MNPLRTAFTVLVLILLVVATDTVAQSEYTLSHQGVLSKPGGEPVDSMLSMSFKLYKGGVQVWSETHPSVQVTEGGYEVALGAFSPFDTVSFDVPVELGITVGADPEMNPRQVLRASPRAMTLQNLRVSRVQGDFGSTVNIIGGHDTNSMTAPVEGATISGGGSLGENNRVIGNFGTVAGGRGNVAALYAFSGGGFDNTANGTYSVMGGGQNNTASFLYSTVGGGSGNVASATQSTVSGGGDNTAEGTQSTVSGGSANLATGVHSTVGGGQNNQSTGIHSTVGGGQTNEATANHTVVAGGESNDATVVYALVGGGRANLASNQNATVGGGAENVASGFNSVISGGQLNVAGATASTVGGGGTNVASNVGSTVAGGLSNTASGHYSSVGGGNTNTASGLYATVAGGLSNKAIGNRSAVPGGENNHARGNYSLAAGFGAKANNTGSFVWNDGAGGPDDTLATTLNYQFLIKAANGVGIGQRAPNGALHVTQSDIGVTAGDVERDDIIVEDADAILGLYSDDGGTWASGIVMGELNNLGLLVNKWAIVRETSGAGSDLHFRFGTDQDYLNATTQFAITDAGNVFVTGNLDVGGTLSKAMGSFKIDHPLDPENKYLYHSFVESPDMMNVYNGNVALDEAGQAAVELPAYFEALNRDFRYQLTPIGAPGPNLYVAEKITGSRFRIAGGKPGMEVSWMVTGIRKDPYAELNRIEVEVDKQAGEIGTYLHPDAYLPNSELKSKNAN